MNNAVFNQSFLALANYKDPAEQLLSSADPLPPSIRPGFLHSSAEACTVQTGSFPSFKMFVKF